MQCLLWARHDNRIDKLTVVIDDKVHFPSSAAAQNNQSLRTLCTKGWNWKLDWGNVNPLVDDSLTQSRNDIPLIKKTVANRTLSTNSCNRISRKAKQDAKDAKLCSPHSVEQCRNYQATVDLPKCPFTSQVNEPTHRVHKMNMCLS